MGRYIGLSRNKSRIVRVEAKMKSRNLFVRFVYETDITILMLITSGIPILFLILWGLLVNKFFQNIELGVYNYLILALLSFLPGFCGLFQVLRKEAPGVAGIPIKGMPAVLSGIIYMALFWGGSIIGIYCLYIG